MQHRYLMRSKLFVPGSRPELFLKAIRSGVDAVSFDLEDAVLEEQKEQARENIASFLGGQEAANSEKLFIVRVNEIAHPGIEKDINAIVLPRLDILNLPKAESAGDVNKLEQLLCQAEKKRGITRPISILVNIESPKGLRLISEIVSASDRIMGVQIGFADLFGSLGIDRTNLAAANQVRLMVKLAAGEADIDAYDTAYLNVKDVTGYQKDCENAKSLGFAGKSCIHPTQVETANEIFSPSEEETVWARKIIDYINSTATEGAFLLDGQMVDKPVIQRARQVLKLLQNGQ